MEDSWDLRESSIDDQREGGQWPIYVKVILVFLWSLYWSFIDLLIIILENDRHFGYKLLENITDIYFWLMFVFLGEKHTFLCCEPFFSWQRDVDHADSCFLDRLRLPPLCVYWVERLSVRSAEFSDSCLSTLQLRMLLWWTEYNTWRQKWSHRSTRTTLHRPSTRSNHQVKQDGDIHMVAVFCSFTDLTRVLKI